VYDMRPGADNNGYRTEAQLIAGIRAGDWLAFETVYRTYWPQLVAFARGYGARSKHDAQELAQDVFFGIWRNRTTWDVQSGLEAYLFGAIRNRVHRMRRSRLPRVGRPVRTSVDNSGEHRPIIGELTAATNTIVDRMPDRCRDVYRLRYVEGLDIRTIAKMLNLALPTVKRHQARAPQGIRRLLTPDRHSEQAGAKRRDHPAPQCISTLSHRPAARGDVNRRHCS